MPDASAPEPTRVDRSSERHAASSLSPAEGHADALASVVFQSSPDCVKLLDADGSLITMNENGRCLMEVEDISHIVGHAWASFWPAESQSRVRAALEAARAGQADRFEAFCPTAKGTPKWWDVTVAPVRDADGRVHQIVSSSRDITARRAADETLRRNHDTFHHLIANNPFGIYVVDAEFNLVQVSAGAQKVFSTVRPLLGRNFGEIIHILWPEPFAERVIQIFQHVLATGEPHSETSTVEARADIGAVEAYDWRVERIALPDGRWGAVCYFYDLTERRAFEEALRIRENRLRLGAQVAGLGISEIDYRAGVHLLSTETARLYGLGNAARIVPRDAIHATFHPEDRDRVMALMTGSLEPTGDGWLSVDHRIVWPDGQVRWLQVRKQVFVRRRRH